MSSKAEGNGAASATGIVLLMLLMTVLGVVMGWDCGCKGQTDRMQIQASDAGAAYWSIDPISGDKTLTYSDEFLDKHKPKPNKK